MARKRTVDPIPEQVQQFVVDTGRLTALENALRHIEEEVGRCNFRIDSYERLKTALISCRQTAREALGEEEEQ